MTVVEYDKERKAVLDSDHAVSNKVLTGEGRSIYYEPRNKGFVCLLEKGLDQGRW